MKILLTGHEGWIGKALHDSLSHSHSVVTFDKSCQFLAWKSEWERTFYPFPGKTPKLVIHCGAITDPNASPTDIIDMNVRATCEIISACQWWKAKLLFISSAAVDNPINLYGSSKMIAEDFIKRDLKDYCILRPQNVWSEKESERPFKSIAYKLLTEQLDEVYKDCKRDFVHISDVVRCVEALADHWEVGIFDLGKGQSIDLSELAFFIHDKLGDMSASRRMPALTMLPDGVKRCSVAQNNPLCFQPTQIQSIYERLGRRNE